MPAEQNDLHMTGIVGIMCMQSLVLIYRQTSAMINDLSSSVFGKRLYAERERLSFIANDRKRISSPNYDDFSSMIIDMLCLSTYNFIFSPNNREQKISYIRMPIV